jgi:hypothetical protein
VDDVRAALFGLDGFEVLDAVETADGLLEVTVETIDPVLGCPECGTPVGAGNPSCGCRKYIAAALSVVSSYSTGRYIPAVMNLVTTFRHLVIGL